MIDMERCLSEKGIDFKRGGEHTKVTRNHIGVNCPFCGYDEGYHLGFNLETGFFYCWRVTSHRGYGPVAFLKHVLGINWTEAESVADEYFDWDAKLDRKIRKRLRKIKELTETERLPLLEEKPKQWKRFYDYLRGRGLDWEDITDYPAKIATEGRYAWRCVWDIAIGGTVVASTGRAIGRKTPSYLANELKQDSIPVWDLLLNYDRLPKGGVITLGEGPMDGIKVGLGLGGTCLFGLKISDFQLDLLASLEPGLIVILLDSTAWASAVLIEERLSTIFPDKVLRLDIPYDDPGTYDKEELRDWLWDCVQEWE